MQIASVRPNAQIQLCFRGKNHMNVFNINFSYYLAIISTSLRHCHRSFLGIADSCDVMTPNSMISIVYGFAGLYDDSKGNKNLEFNRHSSLIMKFNAEQITSIFVQNFAFFNNTVGNWFRYSPLLSEFFAFFRISKFCFRVCSQFAPFYIPIIYRR